MTRSVSPYKTSIDKDNAYWMARLARAVYISKDDNSPDDEAILEDLRAEDPKFQRIEGVSKSSAQAAFVEHEDYLCMTFRGTDTTMNDWEAARDWIDNLKAFPKQTSFGRFHMGFYQSFEDVWNSLKNAYDLASKKKSRPLFFTGHSLGGAMASIAAAKRVGEDLPFTSTYTFGQPRAMTRKTAQAVNAECLNRFFRFQNNNDIVTRLPARLMGYSHIGTFIYIKEEGDLDHEPGYWLRFLDSMHGIVDYVRDDDSDKSILGDHDMDNYLEAIKEWNTEDGFLKQTNK